MLNGLDLFSGIGGLTLALSNYVRPVAYCENDRYCQAVLHSRMFSNELPMAPIWNDVRTLKGTMLPEIDIITGGFPCQDISVAGTGKGLDGERSGLFFEILRLVSECLPRFVFLENVPAIAVRGLDRILLEFDALGYDARWTIVSAQELGAVHIRERWFMLAYSNGIRLRQESRQEIRRDNTKRERALEHNNVGKEGEYSWASQGFIKPHVDRTGDGIPCRMDRARALGNAVVPIQAKEAFERLMGLSAREVLKELG